MENTICMTVFAILTIVIHQSIRTGLNMDGLKCWILSACVSILAIVSMHEAFLPANATGKTADIPTILLPYAAMGIAILVILIVLAVARLSKSMHRPESPNHDHRTDKHEEPHESRIRIHNPK